MKGRVSLASSLVLAAVLFGGPAVSAARAQEAPAPTPAQLAELQKWTGLTKSDYPEARSYAARRIGALKLPDGFSTLYALLKDSDSEPVRIAAAQGLVQSGDDRAQTVLLERFRSERDMRVRCAIASLLGQFKNSRSTEALLPRVKASPGADGTGLIIAAANALANIGGDDAADALRYALRKAESDRNLWMQLARAAGRAKAQNAADELAKGLRSDNAAARRTAVEALGQVGSKDPVPDLVKALNDTDMPVRLAALRALSTLDPEGAGRHFTRLMANPDEAPELRIPAAAALAAAKNEEAFATLMGMLNAQSTTPTQLAAEALGQLKDERAIPVLSAVLQDHTDQFTREKLADALARFGPAAAGPLVELAKHSEPHVRYCAARALRSVRSDQTVWALMGMLTDEASWVRLSAAQALAGLSDEDVVEALKKALNDASDEVRVAAAEALAAIRKPEMLDTVLTLTGSRDPGAAVAAVRALAFHQDERAARALRTAATSDRLEIRSAALVVLRDHPDPESIPALVKALDDRCMTARRDAALALARLDWSGDGRGDRARVLAALGEYDLAAKCGSEGMEAIAALLKTDCINTRRTVVRLFASSKKRDVVDPLLDTLKNDTEPALRSDAAKALGNHPSRAVAKALQEVAQTDPDPAVARAAEQTLQRMTSR